MEANQGKSLQDLPESQSDFWEGEKYSKQIEPTSCEHQFVYKSAREVECINCNIGFVLAKDWHIKNKKLYYKDNLVI